jgi:hypothetical protein
MKSPVKLLLLLGVLALLVSILWVVLLPTLVVSTIRSRTGFVVQVDRISVNPFTADVAIRGLVMKNPEGWPMAGFVELREFRADANLLSLLGNRFIANEIVVDVAQLTLVVNQQGAMNAVAFKEGLAGRETTDAAKPTPRARQEFLIRHLGLRFDKLVYADYSGRRPNIKEYNLSLNRDMRDVDSVTKIISPFTGNVLGLVTNTLGGMFKGNPDLLKELASPLQDAGKTTGEKLKGLLDSLDKRRL